MKTTNKAVAVELDFNDAEFLAGVLTDWMVKNNWRSDHVLDLRNRLWGRNSNQEVFDTCAESN